MIYLGFDTSNYTTSAAAVGDGFLKNERKILAVPKGMRGIRQSDAVFSHMKTMPILYERLADSDAGRCRGRRKHKAAPR